MNFGEAVLALKGGAGVQRSTWPSDMVLCIYSAEPEEGDTFTRDFILLRSRDECVPWTASHSDLLADDWQLAPAAGAP